MLKTIYGRSKISWLWGLNTATTGKKRQGVSYDRKMFTKLPPPPWVCIYETTYDHSYGGGEGAYHDAVNMFHANFCN